MAGIAKVLRYTAFTTIVLFGLFGGLFVAGSAFDDLGGWAAVGMTALWAVPLVALSAFALLRPEAAGPVFVALTATVALFTLADSAFGIVPRDEWGPVAAVTVLALAVALAFLGLHRGRLAGSLLLALAVAQLATTVLDMADHGQHGGPGPGTMLGGSSGILVIPLLVVGLMFLVAAAMDHQTSEPRRSAHIPTAH